MTDKLTDSEIVKEIQGIKESMKRHTDLTNEMGQDLLRIDEEYTGGSKVWLTTDYFKKVVKHFCHSNYLVKCLELVFDYINHIEAKVIKEQNKNSKLRNERNRLQAENEKLKKAKYIFANVDYCADDLDKVLKENAELKAEVERLHKNPIIPTTGFWNLLYGALIVTETLEEYNKFRRTFKAEAYKEFDELLKDECLSYPLGKDDITMLVDVERYNNLLKELVGEDDAKK